MFERYSDLILTPETNTEWMNLKVYNPGIILENNTYHMWFNAVGSDWENKIAYAKSENGINFKVNKFPIFEKGWKEETKGPMDPRVSKVDNKYFITYSSDNGKRRALSLATTGDLKNWQRHGLMLRNWDAYKAGVFKIENGERKEEDPGKAERSKAGGIFPEKVKGKYLMIFGNSNLWLAESDNGIDWYVDYEEFLLPSSGDNFDSLSVQGGPPPIKTSKGWLYFYHGKRKGSGDYAIGYLVLDLNDPRKILYRTSEPVLVPEKDYEIKGLVDILDGGFEAMSKLSRVELENFVETEYKENRMPKIVFSCGAVLVEDKIRLYYGAADTVIGMAEARIEDLIKVVV